MTVAEAEAEEAEEEEEKKEEEKQEEPREQVLQRARQYIQQLAAAPAAGPESKDEDDETPTMKHYRLLLRTVFHKYIGLQTQNDAFEFVPPLAVASQVSRSLVTAVS